MVSARGEGRFAVIALAPNEWRGQWVNRQQLLSRLGQHHPVVYSTGTWFTWDRASPEWRAAKWRGGFSRLNDVWVDEPPRWLMRRPATPIWDRWTIRAQQKRWRRQLLGSEELPLIAYVFHPAFYPFLRGLDASAIVYHAYDLFDHQPGWTEEMERDQRRLL